MTRILPPFRSTSALQTALSLAMAVALPAQTPPSPTQRIATVEQQVLQALIGFARAAESAKLPSRARVAYETILEHYDLENPTARKGLGWKQVKGEWQAPAAGSLAVDAAGPDQRKKVAEAWLLTSRKVAKLHRELGLALRDAGEPALSTMQLERALTFDPDDIAAHQALGHEQFEGFYGTAEQLAFVQRMRSMLEKAKELRAVEPEVKEVPDNKLPSTLQSVGLRFYGARSEHFEHWVVDSLPDAMACAQWAERAAALGTFLLGPDNPHLLRTSALRWCGCVRDDAQRDLVLEKAPTVRGKLTLEDAKLFGGLLFDSATGRASMSWHEREIDADHSVATVTKRCLVGGRNVGFGEGLVHATTWMLCGTTLSYYCDLPKTQSGGAKLMPRDPKAWLTRLQDEIEAGTDYPLVQLARERADNFHESARIKSWSFMLWLLARHPDRWLKLLDKLSQANMMPEDVTQIFATVMERDLGEIEDEWRAWARRGSRIGKASGFLE